MRPSSIEQLLRVVEYAYHHYRVRKSIEDAYNHAVNKVAREDQVKYQTVGDLCRRRLSLREVSEFKEMLHEAFRGNNKELRGVIKNHAPRTYRGRIDSFFDSLNDVATNPKDRNPGLKTPSRPANIASGQDFSAVLDAAEQLDLDEQAELVAVVSRRLNELGRQRVVATVQQVRREFAAGQARTMSAQEILREALS